MSLLTLLSFRSAVTLSVAAVRVTDVALAPSVMTGAATVPVPAVAERMSAVAPSVSSIIQVAVTPVRLTYLVPEVAINGSMTVTVSSAALQLRSVAPSVSTAIVRSVSPVVGTYAAVAPAVQYVKLVPSATLRVIAIAPTITGGGGVGLGVIPKRSGDN